MVISVIQQGRGVLHFSGELDSYNLQLLGEHTAFTAESPEREVRIALEPGEHANLTTEGRRVLERLRTAGYAVSIQPAR